jgi:hypothetical protein
MPISNQAAALLSCALVSVSAGAAIPTHALDNGTVRATVTEAIGGRLLSFSLAGQPKFLRLDEQAGDPAAKVDAASENVGYLGHEIWVGPQKQWWVHQSVNPELAARKANWPPDPYLSLAPYTVTEQSARAVTVASPASPVSGVQLSKRYALVDGKPNSLKLDVSATNRRDSQVAWDIWFNTRTHADTRVYVPVAASSDVRLETVQPAAPLSYTLRDRVFSLDMPADAPGQRQRKGKLFLQPSSGWMAGFHGAQAFIVQFVLRPRAEIHPDQGQIELYNDFQPGNPNAGLLEMEVHAPYRQLAPGQSMNASETWTILPYAGASSREAHIAFLRKQAKALGLGGL